MSGQTEGNGKDLASAVVSRDKTIVRTSIIGIIANVFLAGFKAVIGLFANSIAIVLDAVNNLSDALSSVITIIGTRLANKKPDKEHPLGHGRAEYLTAVVVAAIVLYAGITSLVESVKKIIHPETADYSTVGLIIIGAAIVVKLLLGQYVKKKGKEANSAALEASGSDALFDAILSASVLVSAIIFLTTGLSLEAWVGVIIAGFIIKAGIEMMMDTINDILGRRADPELSFQIKSVLLEEPEVRGVYDLFINDYGPDRNYASLHVELPDTMTVDQVDVLTRRAQIAVYQKTGVILTGVGVYSYNTSDNEAAQIRNAVQEKVLSHPWALQMHGFYADTKAKSMRFDVVLSFDVDHKEGMETLQNEIEALYPDYQVVIVGDVDISD